MHFVIELALGSGENIRFLSWQAVLERVQLWGGVASEPIRGIGRAPPLELFAYF
jgi:hypothetical protein